MSSQQPQQGGTTQRAQQQQQYITAIEPNDVLLGRGNHVHNPGNEKFRKIVLARSVEYWSCNNNVTKDTIARQIVDTIISSHGRFLRKAKIESKGGDAADAAGTTSDDATSISSDLWVVADMETILIKVKQTFRDFTASAKKRKAASISSKNIVQPSLQSSIGQRSGASLGLLDVNQRLRTDPVESITSNMARHINSNVLPSIVQRAIRPNVNTGLANATLLRRDAEGSTRHIARALQLGQIQTELSRNRVDNYLLESLLRQRAVESLQLQQQHRQQQTLGDNIQLLMNPSRQQQIDPLSAILQNNTSHDPLLLRQRLLQHHYLTLQQQDQFRLDDVNDRLPSLNRLSQQEALLLNTTALQNVFNLSEVLPNITDRDALHLSRQIQSRSLYQHVGENTDRSHFLPTQYDVLSSASLLGADILHELGPARTDALPRMSNTNSNPNDLSIPIGDASAAQRNVTQSQHSNIDCGGDNDYDKKPPPKSK
jgi:hypothetical protein